MVNGDKTYRSVIKEIFYFNVTVQYAEPGIVFSIYPLP